MEFHSRNWTVNYVLRLNTVSRYVKQYESSFSFRRYTSLNLTRCTIRSVTFFSQISNCRGPTSSKARKMKSSSNPFRKDRTLRKTDTSTFENIDLRKFQFHIFHRHNWITTNRIVLRTLHAGVESIQRMRPEQGGPAPCWHLLAVIEAHVVDIKSRSV